MMKVKNMEEKSSENVNTNENTVKEYSFARYICELRLKRNLTQKALAEKIKVSDRTISKWENGLTVPDLHNIRSICKELGVSANAVVLEKYTLKDHFHNFLHWLVKLGKLISNNIFKLIFAIIFILLLIYFINNYNAISIYTLNYDSDNIEIGNGYFIKSKVDNILLIDNIELKNIDYEIASAELELYTLVNGDKIVLYQNDAIDDIYLQELSGYPDILHEDVIRAITKNAYLTITTYNESNEENVYECIISFKRSFSNNKLTYSSYPANTEYNNDYKRFLNMGNSINTTNTIYKNLNASPAFSSINEKLETQNLETIPVEDTDNKLKDLGYSYDKENDSYTKEDGNKSIVYKPSFNLLVSNEVVDGSEQNLYYYIDKERIDFRKTDEDGIYIVYFKYTVNSKTIFCRIGNCKNYQSELDYILTEYQAISETL